MKIKRISSSERGTFGVLLINDMPFCLTMELPDRKNQTGISCIPVGIYKWKKYISPTKGNVIYLTDTPNRSYIYIHIANWPSDVRGCIGVGYKYGNSANGEFGVLESGNAMKSLLEILPDNGTIEVINA